MLVYVRVGDDVLVIAELPVCVTVTAEVGVPSGVLALDGVPVRTAVDVAVAAAVGTPV